MKLTDKKEIKDINRREFIKTSALIAVAVSVPGFTSCKDNDRENAQQECKTTADILGPFYKEGAPFVENIIPRGNTTPPLVIEGRIFSDCNVTLADAIVEIWNANENGEYDTSSEYFFRGSYKTSGNGDYRFVTIIPGRYLNGQTYRPSHIHFRITAPGHGELVSQIYFKEDPFISSDPWASASQAQERILTIGKDGSGTDIINFDIHLNKIP